jgi:hypothetical protein
MNIGTLKRMAESSLEGFEPKMPIPGLEKAPLVPLKQAISTIDIEDAESLIACAEVFFPDGRTFDGGLTVDEARSLYLYSCEVLVSDGDKTVTLYQFVNGRLREPNRARLEPCLLLVKLLLKGTEKLLRRIDKILWRGEKEDLFDKFKDRIGQTMILWGFSSYTEDMCVVDDFLPKEGGTMFCLRMDFAASLSKFSAFPQEAEYLVPSGTQVELRNVYKRDKTTIVELIARGNVLSVNLCRPSAGAALLPTDSVTVYYFSHVAPSS